MKKALSQPPTTFFDSMKQPKDLTNREKTKPKWWGVQPQKYLGQHFLRSKSVLAKIIEAADLKTDDLILEIGPGEGVLTRELAKKAKKVIAVEKDEKLIPLLRDNLKSFTNIEIVQGDILKIWDLGLDWKLKIRNWKLIANLPYYIATVIIRKALESQKPPEIMVLMLQKEVAQRICACPPKLRERRQAKPLRLRRGYGGQAKMNLLAVSVQFYADVKIIDYVSKDAFWPRPKVDSAIIKIRPLINADRKLINTDLFFKIVKAGFSQPRKQLLNNLSKDLKLPKEKIKDWLNNNGINPSKRGQDLSLDEWINLARRLPRA